MAKRVGLGKGLDALFMDNNTEDGSVTKLKVAQIEPNKSQPRSDFSDEALRELSDSIRQHGILQPLVVRPMESGIYQIVAGERRWRASRMAGLTEVPVVIRELSDSETLEIAIIENLQREDLNVVELAYGYKALMENYDLTQEQIAERLGKSRPVIANTVRLLALPTQVLELVRSGAISAGHAKALLSLADEDKILETAKQVVNGKLLVRDIEKLAKAKNAETKEQQPNKGTKAAESPDPVWGANYYKEMEIALSTELGRKVTILNQGKRSTIELEFYSNEDLSDIAARLTKSQS